MFRLIYSLILFLIFTTSSFAFQIDSSNKTVEESDSLKTLDSSSLEEEILDFSETMPQYPGGMNQLRLYVLNAYQLPLNYHDQTSGGTILVRFAVLKDGSVGDVTIVKGLEDCEECNQNAIKAIESIPEKFTPGYQDGEAVNVRFSLPIVVKVDKKKRKKSRT